MAEATAKPYANLVCMFVLFEGVGKKYVFIALCVSIFVVWHLALKLLRLYVFQSTLRWTLTLAIL